MSVRVTLSIPLRVDGRTAGGEEFTVRTQTSSVSELGCLLLLEKDVTIEDTIVLMNEHTRQSVFCTVISQRRHRDGKRYVGAGFLSPKPNFWGIVFSKPGARSLKRQYDLGKQK
ncbi:MAG TPA: hypothetical protein VGI16_08430 [Candidatus Acidoferrum sp.]